MKNHMNFTNIIRFCTLFIFSSVATMACTEMETPMEGAVAQFTANSPNMEQNIPNNEVRSNGFQTVTIIDQTMNKPMARVTLPAGWKIQQDVASNLQVGGFTKFRIDAIAPDGGMYIVLPTNTSYSQIPDTWTGQMTGYGFVELATYMTQMTLRDKSAPLQISGLRPSAWARQTPEYQQHKQKLAQFGYDFEVYEMAISGNMHGQPWKGEAGFAIMDYSRQMGGQMRGGTIMYGAVQIAPAQNYAKFDAQCKLIKYVTDPTWDAIQSNKIKQQTQHANRSHQSRMASNQAAFDATQKAHRETQAAYQASNDSWYDRNLGAGSEYNSTSSFNDAMTGHSTFNDAYSGHQTRQEGHYDYWYSNGLGEYYGTDDANFNPASLQGDWQSVQPLSPTGN